MRVKQRLELLRYGPTLELVCSLLLSSMVASNSGRGQNIVTTRGSMFAVRWGMCAYDMSIGVVSPLVAPAIRTVYILARQTPHYRAPKLSSFPKGHHLINHLRPSPPTPEYHHHHYYHHKYIGSSFFH